MRPRKTEHIQVRMVKTMVDQVDQAAKVLELDRSGLIREAVKAFLATKEDTNDK